MADLRFDRDDFATAIIKYNEIAVNLRSTKDTLVQKMAELKNCWKSDAGETFDSFYNENWVAHVDLYVSVLEQLAELLKQASQEYKTLETKISDIYK